MKITPRTTLPSLSATKFKGYNLGAYRLKQVGPDDAPDHVLFVLDETHSPHHLLIPKAMMGSPDSPSLAHVGADDLVLFSRDYGGDRYFYEVLG